MSRIGNKVIKLPAGVTVVSENGMIKVSGPKGTLQEKLPEVISFKVEDGHLEFTRANEEKHTKQLHGTIRALVASMIVGVSQGYRKKLIITGIGYRAAADGNGVKLSLGYSHAKVVKALPNTKIEVPSATEVVVSGIDKQVVGQLAALIRACREPEPYKGKGVAYEGEKIRRKEGKKAGKK